MYVAKKKKLKQCGFTFYVIFIYIYKKIKKFKETIKFFKRKLQKVKIKV